MAGKHSKMLRCVVKLPCNVKRYCSHWNFRKRTNAKIIKRFAHGHSYMSTNVLSLYRKKSCTYSTFPPYLDHHLYRAQTLKRRHIADLQQFRKRSCNWQAMSDVDLVGARFHCKQSLHKDKVIDPRSTAST